MLTKYCEVICCSLKEQEIADPKQLYVVLLEVVVEIVESLADRSESISSVLQCSLVQEEMW